MTTEIHREETDFPFRRIPSDLCRYVTFREMMFDSSFLKCELRTVTPFQSVQYGNGEKTVSFSKET